MNITSATQKDKANIIALWQQAFGDDEEYISHFLDYAFNNANILLIKENDILISMLTLIPAVIKTSSIDISALYIYAVATDKEYRGKGYCRKLLSYAEDIAKEQNISALFLIAETKNLTTFYKKFGFDFFEKSDVVMKNNATPYIYKPAFDDVGNIYANAMVKRLKPDCDVFEIVIE